MVLDSLRLKTAQQVRLRLRRHKQDDLLPKSPRAKEDSLGNKGRCLETTTNWTAKKSKE